LDEEASDLMARANPVPPPPAGMDQTYVVADRFRAELKALAIFLFAAIAPLSSPPRKREPNSIQRRR
jgi:hypothetical protein